MDFVLWKPSSDDLPGWDSPWGRGRPGWHIECSAMSRALFGEKFDIHGGGLDLAFPHHENEKAQSCSICGEDCFAQVWMHNEMLQVEGKKMSKSLGNFFSVRDLLDQGIPGEVIRFVYLSTHYRKPMDWTEKKAEEAEKTLAAWRNSSRGVKLPEAPSPEVVACLSDDLNTAGAISLLHEIAKTGDSGLLKRSAQQLGLLTDELKDWNWGDFTVMNVKLQVSFRSVRSNADQETAIAIAAKWRELRERREFASADRLRDSAAAAGLQLRAEKGNVVAVAEGTVERTALEALK
jgi:cysteinyl-tRNA synthetase